MRVQNVRHEELDQQVQHERLRCKHVPRIFKRTFIQQRLSNRMFIKRTSCEIHCRVMARLHPVGNLNDSGKHET